VTWMYSGLLRISDSVIGGLPAQPFFGEKSLKQLILTHLFYTGLLNGRSVRLRAF
jgi:hypothetical protein